MQGSAGYRVVDLAAEAGGAGSYDNHPVAEVNDHVVRISTMTEPYYWHCHPDSDESFLVLEGILCIEFEGESVDLAPGRLLTIRRGTAHRTRPVGERCVNLTFERANARTVALDPPTDAT